jgi:hypothetical protein
VVLRFHGSPEGRITVPPKLQQSTEELWAIGQFRVVLANAYMLTISLPDGALGADHIREVFGRMGFSDQEIVALSGAHALGRCHSDRSGFDG